MSPRPPRWTDGCRFALVPKPALLDPRLTDTAVRVYAVLCYLADEKGQAYPPDTTLARLTGRNRCTIRRAVAQLRAAGYLATSGYHCRRIIQLFVKPATPGAQTLTT